MSLSAEMRANVGRLNTLHDVREQVEGWADRVEVLERTVRKQKDEMTAGVEGLIGLRTSAVRLRGEFHEGESRRCLEKIEALGQ